MPQSNEARRAKYAQEKGGTVRRYTRHEGESLEVLEQEAWQAGQRQREARERLRKGGGQEAGRVWRECCAAETKAIAKLNAAMKQAKDAKEGAKAKAAKAKAKAKVEAKEEAQVVLYLHQAQAEVEQVEAEAKQAEVEVKQAEVRL
eukprot:COSAG02_NODE_4427_length_5372_cov_4.047791_7_plen_146_part_00